MTHLDSKLECPVCDKECPTKVILNKHIKDVHSQKVKCECCDKIFSNKTNLTVHLKNLEPKPVKPEIPKVEQICDMCGKVQL